MRLWAHQPEQATICAFLFIYKSIHLIEHSYFYDL